METYCYYTVKKALEAENRGEKDYGLCLNDNELTSLPESIGVLKNLQWLNLGGNPSLDWDVAFKLLQKLPNLQELHLWCNLLTSLPASIGELNSLQTLYLEHNQLTSLPEDIGKLKNLQWIDLSWNLLTNLPKSIGELNSLQTLYLEHNQLTSKEKGRIEKLLPNTEIIF